MLVEDDTTLHQLLNRILTRHGYAVDGVHSWAEADRYLSAHEPRLILADLRLPDGSTLDRLPDLVESFPVIVLTAYGSVKSAVDAIKAGAAEYLVKPVSHEELLLHIERVLEDAALRHDHQFCRQRMQARDSASSFMIGKSQALGQVKEMIEAVAPSEMTVLIQGESGTGKELVARAIHLHSERADRNFVAVDCCTLQEKLFESELFGHERGSFTGAERQKKGLIEGAEGGTLFLDEIGEIEPTVQAKLLRVLEAGTFRRVGGTKDLMANVRVVAATNRDLERMSREGGFRADLYYRLNAFTIRTPPLRERSDDIPFLVEYFIRNHDFSRRINKQTSPEVLRELTAYSWPGNIRELKNVIERAIILSRERKRIEVSHLGLPSSQVPASASLSFTFDHDPSLAELEHAYLKMQLHKQSGLRSRVAEVLGVSERSVYRLIKRYQLAD